jgi:hypothetical protein
MGGMKAFEATAMIEAEPNVIGAILTDAPGYPSWDSGGDPAVGRIAPGEKITVHARVAPGRAFPVEVVEFSLGRTMVRSGGLPLGLFKGVRTFTLAPQAAGTIALTMREEYSGPLAPLITRSIPDLGQSFGRFANGLKHRAEGGL